MNRLDDRRAGTDVKEFLQKTLDSLLSHLAILEEDGTILAVNAAWRRFAACNDFEDGDGGIGLNYLEVCEHAAGDCSDEGRLVAEGIRDVIAGRKAEFALEYPCHSPSGRRWFNVRISRFEVGRAIRVVVSHDDITARMLAEIELQEANRRLELLATTDGLTGLANRREFDGALDRQWRRSQRGHAPLSVAILDVDCFKQYNDRLGHLAGDDCLRAVARSIRDRARRPDDLAARFGGEEFALILPGIDADRAAGLVREVLQAIRSLAIPHADSSVSSRVITASAGLATTIPRVGEDALSLLARADEALYEAKSLGRDRLVTRPLGLLNPRPVPA